MAGNFIAIRPHIYVTGAVIYAANHNSNETTVYTKHNDAFHETTGHQHTGIAGDAPPLPAAGLEPDSVITSKILDLNVTRPKLAANAVDASKMDLTDTYNWTGQHDYTLTPTAPGFVPIGSIIPFYDFNATLTFNTTSWEYCNGSAVASASSPIFGQTLPDLSNRYLVGFGTEGGGDIGTAVWATAAVGAASHTLNLQHSHTVNAHTHDLANHTHMGGSHTHSIGSHVHNVPDHYHGKGTLNITASGSHIHDTTIDEPAGGIATSACLTANTTIPTTRDTAAATHTHASGDFAGLVGATASGNDGDAGFNTDGSSGTTGADGVVATTVPSTNTSGSTSPGTDNQLSAAQSVQPRSIRVRYIMRVL